MKKLLAFSLFLSLVLTGLSMGSNELRRNTFRWNQELTVTVMTEDGPKTGSSVSTVVFSGGVGPWITPEAQGLSSRAFGESVVIELSPGSHFAVPMKGYETLFLRALRPEGWKEADIGMLAAAPIGTSAEVPADELYYPVYFLDDADPSSLRRFDLGPDGERLISARIRKVEVKPEFGIDRIFPWMHWPSKRLLTRNTERGYRTSMYFDDENLGIAFDHGSFTSKIYREIP